MHHHRRTHLKLKMKPFALGLLLALSVGVCGKAQQTSSVDRLKCLFNGDERRCEIESNGDNLVLRLKNKNTISVDRRGRCNNRKEDGETTRTCNVRVGLPDDFVFGLVVRGSRTGTTITTPQFEIRIPDLTL